LFRLISLLTNSQLTVEKVVLPAHTAHVFETFSKRQKVNQTVIHRSSHTHYIDCCCSSENWNSVSRRCERVTRDESRPSRHTVTSPPVHRLLVTKSVMHKVHKGPKYSPQSPQVHKVHQSTSLQWPPIPSRARAVRAWACALLGRVSSWPACCHAEAAPG